MQHSRQSTPRGIALMLVGMLLFASNDALGKHLVGTYSVGQLMALRGAVGLAAMLPLLRRWNMPLLVRAHRPDLQILRFLLSPAEASPFFWALITLPLANVITYYLAGPIWVIALSALLLRERVGWRHWVAVCAGFAGVVLAVHPSSVTLSSGSFYALLGSFLYSCFLVVTGRLGSVPAPVLTAQQFLATLLFGTALLLFGGWTNPGGSDLGFMLVLGAGSLAGNLCVNLALRLGPAVSIVPFENTMLLWGILLGYFVFGDIPGWNTLTGAAAIVGAGLFLAVLAHRDAAPARSADGPDRKLLI